MTTLPAPTMAFSPMVMPPKQRCAGTNGGASLNKRALAIPIGFGFEFSERARCPRIAIIDKRHSVSDEDLGLDRHAFTNEGMTRDLATIANLRAFLDLNERADPCVVANLAAVKIDEGINPNVATESDVGRDSLDSPTSDRSQRAPAPQVRTWAPSARTTE